jgi:DNA-binding response OmpR family regulator
VTELTSAQNTAMTLHNSRDPRALHDFLLNWRAGKLPATTDYVLSVVAFFNAMHEHTLRPDITIGRLTLRFNTRRAFWDERDVDLTQTEFNVVSALVDNLNKFVTYRGIYDVVHYAGFTAGCGVEGYKTNVRSFVKRIRRKFEGLDAQWDEIENYPGFGYRWKKVDVSPTAKIVTPITGVVLTEGGPAPNISAT